MSLETFVTAILSGGLVGAVLVFISGWRERQMKSRVESVARFIELAALAHSRPIDGREVGSAEQIAAVELLAQFGNDYKWLKTAAIAALDDIKRWSSATNHPLHDAADKARDRLND